MPIRVVHFLSSFKFGGIEKLVFDLSDEQTRRNNDVQPQILVLNQKGEFTDKFKQLGINIKAINPKSTYGFTLEQLRQIHSALKSVDIIHLHSFHLFIALLSIISGNKIIYTEHGNFAIGRKKRLSDRVNHFFRKCFFKWFTHIVVCNSNFTKSYLNENWDIKSSNVKVVYNGSNVNQEINLNNVKKIKELANNQFCIGTVARLAAVKRIDRLLDVFHAFHRIHQDSYLFIVGDGNLKETLEDRANNLDCSDHILFFGYQSNPLDYQEAFDVCVFPSNHESFGLVAVEAYSVNKPVLVFGDGGGLTEIVSKCDPNDICSSKEDMVNRLSYYYQKKGTKKDTSRVISYFTSRRMEEDYYKFYSELNKCVV